MSMSNTQNTSGDGGGETVTIPREPTDAMLKAGYTAYAESEWDSGRAKRGPERESLPICFRAMIAAAPPPPPTELELATKEAQSLAISLWQQHYREQAPHWKVLPDLRGAISQIDNMTTGLDRKVAAPAAKGGTEVPKLNQRICPACQGERGGMIGMSGGSPDWDDCWTCGGEGFLTENGAAHPVFDKARTTSDPYDERPGPWYDMKRVRQIEKETGIPFASPPPPAGAAGGGSGDLAVLSAGASPGECRVESYDCFESALIWCDDLPIFSACVFSIGFDRLAPAKANAAFAGALWNAYRSGRLIEAPTPDLGAQGEPVAGSRRDEIAQVLYGVSCRILGAKLYPGWTPRSLSEDPAAHAAHYAYADAILALEAPAAPRSGSAVTAEEIARLKSTLEESLSHYEHNYKTTIEWDSVTAAKDLHVELTADDAKAILALLQAPRPGETGETLETIAEWCEQTFGPIQPERIVSRAAEEMDELRAEPTKVEEAADVVIVLARYPGLWAAIERKMKVNRARKWRLMGDGTGYHIKDGPSRPHAAAQAGDGGGR